MFEEYIIQPVFKGLGNESLAEFQSVHESLSLSDYIKNIILIIPRAMLQLSLAESPMKKNLPIPLIFL